VQYQTADGTWHAPKYQVKDVDTVTHSGGKGLDKDLSTELQYKQSYGQLGEGDTPAWARSLIEENPGGGGFQLRDDASGDSLVKAYDQLRKAEQQPVVVLDADGPHAQMMTFPERQMLEEAARNADLQGLLTADQRARFQGWGILP
jgi:hypothetical protein